LNASPGLPVDAAQLVAFFDATCRYAEPGTFLSLRAFYDDASEVFAVSGHQVPDDLTALHPQIIAMAGRAALAGRPVVFAPPLATFSSLKNATEADLANGLCLSVELDETPTAARAKLENLLGPATVVVSSGGEWLETETGELHDKLHLHWRLNEPTRSKEDHVRLKEARAMAAELVGGDRSNKPIVHPIRWPGSWHRKGNPRLARIVTLADVELDLAESLERLQEAVAVLPRLAASTPNGADSTGPIQREERDTAELVRALMTAADYHVALTALGMRLLKAGMPDAQAVLTLRGLMLAIPEADRDGDQPGRWQARFGDIARTVSTARAKLGGQASKAPPAIETFWPKPLDFLARGDRPAPVLAEHHIPAALFPFVSDTAERMGVDPAGVALAALVSCASVITDHWKVQPKRYDNTWTESPRLWGAIVGDPSIMKSPVIAACTRPIDKLEADARRRHASEMRSYKAQLKAAKADKTGETSDPPYPRQDRFLIEGATVEAISEVLREDESARFDALAGKVLSRHDEMAEFFGGLDRYKAGGSGGSDRGAYLRLFNGGPFTVDRIQRGSFSIANWSACFLGGIQPGPIQRIAKEAADDGLLQRFIYVVPGEQRTGLDRTPDQAAQARYAGLFPALVALQPPRTLDGEHDQVVAFHADAHQHREAVESYAWAMAAMPDVSTRLKSAFGKWPGLFARLALTFHLIDVADARSSNDLGPIVTIIPPETAERAADFMREIVLPHLLRADHLMFSSTQTGHAAWVAGFILSRGLEAITSRDITRAYGALRSPEMQRELQQTMKHLVTVGWLEPEIPANVAKDISTWTVNPAVHVLFADRGEREKQRRAEARENIRAHVDAIRSKAKRA